jgi:regulator of cell morphogenesis and NO signaling
MQRIGTLLPIVCEVHGASHPELHVVSGILDALAAHLARHVAKVELLFSPYRLGSPRAAEQQAPVLQPFETARERIDILLQEHDTTRKLLGTLRRIAGDYVVPSDGCECWDQLYRALPALEADLDRHIAFESGVLFPHAIALESG